MGRLQEIRFSRGHAGWLQHSWLHLCLYCCIWLGGLCVGHRGCRPGMFAVNAAKPNLMMRRSCSRSLRWSLGNPHETRFKCRKCFSAFLPPFPTLMDNCHFPYRDGIMPQHCNRILCLRCIVMSIFLMVLVSPHNRKSDQRVQRLNIERGSLLLRWPPLARLGLEH